MSVLVNVILLTFGVLFGARLMSVLPASVIKSFTYLLPALIGATFSMIAGENIKASVFAIFIACAIMLVYNTGASDWIPFDAWIFCLIVPILGTALFCYFTYKEPPE